MPNANRGPKTGGEQVRVSRGVWQSHNGTANPTGVSEPSLVTKPILVGPPEGVAFEDVLSSSQTDKVPERLVVTVDTIWFPASYERRREAG